MLNYLLALIMLTYKVAFLIVQMFYYGVFYGSKLIFLIIKLLNFSFVCTFKQRVFKVIFAKTIPTLRQSLVRLRSFFSIWLLAVFKGYASILLLKIPLKTLKQARLFVSLKWLFAIQFMKYLVAFLFASVQYIVVRLISIFINFLRFAFLLQLFN